MQFYVSVFVDMIDKDISYNNCVGKNGDNSRESLVTVRDHFNIILV